MCGITGILHLNNNSIDSSLLKSMTNLLQHRGPDDSGHFIDKNIGLGHRRLSIIDLSKKGRQPMSNKEGTIHIVFNGEIYNFKELRKQLENKYDFASNTDTEVILYGYQEWGEDIIKKLEGMFAFALWDSRKKQLFLVRDRVGQKPLFYYKDKNRFVFASELKSFLLDKDIPQEISPKSISHYLSFGYIPAPLSIFKNIFKLMPGHYLTINQKGKINKKQYWDLRYKPTKKSEHYYIKKILQHLDRATQRRLISDVPLGAFLSGGIDSSAIVAMMAKHLDEVKTFSIGFPESDFDETKYARIVAQKFNTNHKEMIVEPDAIKILPKLVWHYNEPFADSSALPSYYVAKMTKKHVTVALNGDAGDENFAGYQRYAINHAFSIYSKLPQLIKSSFNGLVSLLPPPKSQKGFLRKIKKFSYLTSIDKEKRYIELAKIMEDRTKKDLLKNKLSSKESDEVLSQYLKIPQQPLNKFLYCDIKRYLPDDLLVKMDIATMANSLETRSPFLDHKFMEFNATIPPQLKLKGFHKKYILKKALKNILPKKVLHRKKMGFGVPLEHWFRGELQDYAENVILSQEAIKRGYFKKDKVKKILYQHKKNQRNHSHKIWSLLWLEMWHRIYVDKEVKIE